MKFKLVLDIPDDVLQKHLEFTKGYPTNPQTMEDLVGEINNLCYMGLDCVNAMIYRRLAGLETNDSYVEKKEDPK